jgi:hypothetical protein
MPFMSSDVAVVSAIRLTKPRARCRARAAYAACFANDDAAKSTNARTRNASWWRCG